MGYFDPQNPFGASPAPPGGYYNFDPNAMPPIVDTQEMLRRRLAQQYASDDTNDPGAALRGSIGSFVEILKAPLTAASAVGYGLGRFSDPIYPALSAYNTVGDPSIPASRWSPVQGDNGQTLDVGKMRLARDKKDRQKLAAAEVARAQAKMLNAHADALEHKYHLAQIPGGAADPADATVPDQIPPDAMPAPPSGPPSYGQFAFAPPPMGGGSSPQSQPQAPAPAPPAPQGSAYMPSRGAYGPQPNNMPGAGPSQPAAAWLPPNDPGVNHAQTIGAPPQGQMPLPAPPVPGGVLSLNDQELRQQYSADAQAAGVPNMMMGPFQGGQPPAAPPALFSDNRPLFQSFGSQDFVTGRLPTPAPEMMGGGASAAAGPQTADEYGIRRRQELLDSYAAADEKAQQDPDGLVDLAVKAARAQGGSPEQVRLIAQQTVEDLRKKYRAEADDAMRAQQQGVKDFDQTEQGQNLSDQSWERRQNAMGERQIRVAAAKIESARKAALDAQYESQDVAEEKANEFNLLAASQGSQYRLYAKPPTSPTGLWGVANVKYVSDEKKVSAVDQQAASANENAKTALAATFDDGGFKNTKGVVQRWDKPSGYSSAYSQMVLKMKGKPDRRVLALLDSPKSYVNEDASLGLTPEAKTALDQMTKQSSPSAGTSGNSDLDSLALGKANGALRFKNNQ